MARESEDFISGMGKGKVGQASLHSSLLKFVQRSDASSYNFLVIVGKGWGAYPVITGLQTTSMPPQLILICRRCGKRIFAENRKIDECGEAVHEGCSASRPGPSEPVARQERAGAIQKRLQMLVARGSYFRHLLQPTSQKNNRTTSPR